MCIGGDEVVVTHMKDLIEALTILSRYVGTTPFPTKCETDCLYVWASPPDVPEEERARLLELGFEPDPENPEGGFVSYRFG